MCVCRLCEPSDAAAPRLQAWRIGFLPITMGTLSVTVVLERGPQPLVPFVPPRSFYVDAQWNSCTPVFKSQQISSDAIIYLDISHAFSFTRGKVNEVPLRNEGEFYRCLTGDHGHESVVYRILRISTFGFGSLYFSSFSLHAADFSPA